MRYNEDSHLYGVEQIVVDFGDLELYPAMERDADLSEADRDDREILLNAPLLAYVARAQGQLEGARHLRLPDSQADDRGVGEHEGQQ